MPSPQQTLEKELSPIPSAVYKTVNILISDLMTADIKQKTRQKPPLSMKTELEQGDSAPSVSVPGVQPELASLAPMQSKGEGFAGPGQGQDSSFSLG